MDLPCCKRASMATGWKDPILTIVLTEEPRTSRFVGVSSVLLVSVCLWDYGASKVRGKRCCCCRRPIRVASRWIDLSPLDADRCHFRSPPQDRNMGRRLIRSRRVPFETTLAIVAILIISTGTTPNSYNHVYSISQEAKV